MNWTFECVCDYFASATLNLCCNNLITPIWCRFDGNEWLCNIRCVHVELLRSWFVASWFEVLRDFNWLPGLYGLKFGNLIACRSFLHLNSYNLVGSVTWPIAKEHYKGWHSTLSAMAKAYNTYEERMSHMSEELDTVDWHYLLKYFRSAKF